MRLAKRVALITGGNSGIGQAAANLFAQEGAQVVIAARDAAKAQATIARITAAGGAATFVPCDVRQPADCARAVQFAIEQYGQLDILFNNAGIVPFGTVLETTPETWHNVLETNVSSVFYMCRAALPHMIARGSGVIINNTSDNGIVGAQQLAAYSASKGAVNLMTQSMALDHARQGIRINAVCPGDTYVPRWDSRSDDMATYLRESGDRLPMGRVATPEEIAQAVLFLASDDASYINGHLLVVDGGNTAGGTSERYSS